MSERWTKEQQKTFDKRVGGLDKDQLKILIRRLKEKEFNGTITESEKRELKAASDELKMMSRNNTNEEIDK